MTKEDIFRDYLKSKGLKFTPERKLILKEVFSFHKHFDVEELYYKLRKNNKNISRATIYRTLPLLVRSNLVKETMRYKNNANYEHIFGHDHHDHLLCIKCGKIVEFKEDKIEELQNLVCKKYDFKPVEHRLGIRGYCYEC